MGLTVFSGPGGWRRRTNADLVLREYSELVIGVRLQAGHRVRRLADALRRVHQLPAVRAERSAFHTECRDRRSTV